MSGVRPVAAPLPGAALVRRPRLLDQVRATEPGGVCVVCAAPGYGASSLLRQVAAATSDQVAWVRLGGGEDFWAETATCLGEVLGRRIDGRRRDVLAALPGAPPLWLMIDVDDPSSAADDLGHLAEGLPGQVRLAVATHHEVLHGPVTGGRLVQLDETDLAFRPDEAVDLMAHVDIDTVDAVCEISEGWVAALLVSASGPARRHGDPLWWIRTHGADRLFHPWFERLPERYRLFLRDTSVLDVLDAGSCDAVRAAGDSADLLAAMARAHAHVREVTGPGPTGEFRVWRRHPLLTAFLRRKFHQDASFLPHHSRAAEVFRLRGDVHATMRHLLAAGRTEDAGRYLQEHEAQLFRTGREAETLEWYERLPGEALGATAVRWLRTGWGLALSGDVEEASLTLSRLDALGPDDVSDLETRTQVEGDARTLSAYLAAYRGDAGVMVREAERAVACFDGATDRDAGQMAHILRIRGLQWSGERQRAALLLDELEQRPFPSDNLRETTLAAVRTRRLLDEGRVHVAYRTVQRAVRWMTTRGIDPFGVRQSSVATELAAAQLERGDLEEADGLLVRLTEVQRRYQRFGDLAVTLLAIARLRRVCGDVGAAVRAVREARQVLTEQAAGSPMLRLVDESEARLRMDAGDVVRAERLIGALPPSPERSLLWGRLALVRGIDARRRLVAVDPTTPRQAAEQHLLLAAAKRSTDVRMSEAHLLKAADIASDHGQALLLLEAPSRLRGEAEDVAGRHGHDGLTWLLSFSGQATGPVSSPVGAPISPGELQLLALLPTRDTQEMMATRLGVSKNTVKTRVQRLYQKLSAHNRNEAIANARARGLLT